MSPRAQRWGWWHGVCVAAMLAVVPGPACGRVGFHTVGTDRPDGGVDGGLDADLDGGAGGVHVLSGNYTGNGSEQHIPTPLSHPPAFVIVKGDFDVGPIARTRAMPAGLSKEMGSANVLAPDRIVGLDDTGFTVGSHEDVNAVDVTYHWAAFATVPAVMGEGTYVGNGLTPHFVDALDFEPAFVVVIASIDAPAHARSASMPAGLSHSFQGGAFDDRIEALAPGGFQVGNNGSVNRDRETYYYVAWSNVDWMTVASYVGTGIDPTTQSLTPFQPEYLLIFPGVANAPAHKTDSTGATVDETLLFSANANIDDNIQALLADGFQLGRHRRVNEDGAVYHFVAFARSGS